MADLALDFCRRVADDPSSRPSPLLRRLFVPKEQIFGSPEPSQRMTLILLVFHSCLLFFVIVMLWLCVVNLYGWTVINLCGQLVWLDCDQLVWSTCVWLGCVIKL